MVDTSVVTQAIDRATSLGASCTRVDGGQSAEV